MKRLILALLTLALLAGSAVAQIGTPPGISGGATVGGTFTGGTITGQTDATGAVFTGATPFCFEGSTDDGIETCLAVTDPTSADKTITLPNATGVVQISPSDSHVFFVDSSHYATVKAALDVINADAVVHAGLGQYLSTSYIIHVAPGTYSDALTFGNEKYIRIEGQGGVDLSGTITFTQTQQSGDYYSRVEFVGIDGYRAEKGPALKISGNMSGTRNNDSLTYFTFNGVWITGSFSWDGDGTPVVQFFNSRMTGAIDSVTFTDPDSTILVEAAWTEFAGAITDKVSLYNVRDSDFWGAITTTPWYANRIVNSDFHSSVSIIPQGGAAETTIYLDNVTKATLPAAPVFTGAQLVDLAGNPYPTDHVYVVDATWGPYRTVAAALTAINAEAAAHSSYLDTNYVVKIAPGTYSDALTFTNEKYIRLEGSGVELSGAITMTTTQQSGDYYSRVEFKGTGGYRAEKGPAFKVSGSIAGTRNNDSLTYITFDGVWMTGNFTWTGDGTPVVQYFNSRMAGTIDANTLATADAGILLESDWTEFTGTIQNEVSLYNIRNTDFWGAINTTPWYETVMFQSNTHSTVSIVPQVGASSAVLYADAYSRNSILSPTPTLTGVTWNDFQDHKEMDCAVVYFGAVDCSVAPAISSVVRITETAPAYVTSPNSMNSEIYGVTTYADAGYNALNGREIEVANLGTLAGGQSMDLYGLQVNAFDLSAGATTGYSAAYAGWFNVEAKSTAVATATNGGYGVVGRYALDAGKSVGWGAGVWAKLHGDATSTMTGNVSAAYIDGPASLARCGTDPTKCFKIYTPSSGSYGRNYIGQPADAGMPALEVVGGTGFVVGDTGTYDRIFTVPIAKATTQADGTITSVDLNAARTWTLPDASGLVRLEGNPAVSGSALNLLNMLVQGGYTLDGTLTTTPASLVNVTLTDPETDSAPTQTVMICGYTTAANATNFVKACENIAAVEGVVASVGTYVEITHVKGSAKGGDDADDTIDVDFATGPVAILNAITPADSAKSDLTPFATAVTGSYVTLYCADVAGCDFQPADPGAYDGKMLTLVEKSGSTDIVVKDDDTLVDLAGDADLTLADFDTLTLVWLEASNRWLQVSASNN